MLPGSPLPPVHASAPRPPHRWAPALPTRRCWGAVVTPGWQDALPGTPSPYQRINSLTIDGLPGGPARSGSAGLSFPVTCFLSSHLFLILLPAAAWPLANGSLNVEAQAGAVAQPSARRLGGRRMAGSSRPAWAAGVRTYIQRGRQGRVVGGEPAEDAGVRESLG